MSDSADRVSLPTKKGFEMDEFYGAEDAMCDLWFESQYEILDLPESDPYGWDDAFIPEYAEPPF